METSRYKARRLEYTEGKQITAGLYNIIIGCVVLSGLILNLLMAYFLTEQITAINEWVLFIVYFIGSIGCLVIAYHSPSPVISYIAFLGLSVFMGLLLTWIFSYYDAGTISLAFIITGIITLVMIIVSGIFPKFFLSIGRALFLTLICVIIVEVIFRMLIGFDMTMMDYLVVLLFSGFIGYDWAKAQAYPKTMNNAVDSACDIYVDIINILVRVLSIIGDRD